MAQAGALLRIAAACLAVAPASLASASTAAAPAPPPPCWCPDAKDCLPVSTPAPAREVFAFFKANASWPHLDYNVMTTAAASSHAQPPHPPFRVAMGAHHAECLAWPLASSAGANARGVLKAVSKLSAHGQCTVSTRAARLVPTPEAGLL